MKNIVAEDDVSRICRTMIGACIPRTNIDCILMTGWRNLRNTIDKNLVFSRIVHDIPAHNHIGQRRIFIQLSLKESDGVAAALIFGPSALIPIFMPITIV